MTSRSTLLLAGALSLLLLAGCAGQSARPSAEKQSTVSPVAPGRFIVAGSGTNLPITLKLAEAYNKKNPSPPVEVPKSIGTDGAIKALLSGTLDLGLSSRPLTAEEKASGLKEIPYARVAIVFAVHPGVPDTDVTTADILAIHRGTRTAWGNGQRIQVLIRGKHDSSNHILFALIPGYADAIDESISQKRWQIMYHDADMADALRTKEGAFGHTDSTEIKANAGIKPLTVDGKTPTAEALRNGSYPWAKQLTFLYKGTLSDRAKAFIAFASSAEGRAIIAENGGTTLD